MYPELVQKAKLYAVLHRVDIDLAEAHRGAGCPRCSGPLHQASYERKPRGGPDDLPDEVVVRLGLCCGRPGCRRRTLPPSCLFLGRKVYWGSVVLVVLALRQRRPGGYTARKLRELFGVSYSTLLRWMAFFREAFPVSAGWRRLRGLVAAAVADSELPGGLLASFVSAAGEVEQGLLTCLRFLSPCWATPPGLAS